MYSHEDHPGKNVARRLKPLGEQFRMFVGCTIVSAAST